ncbi:phage tail protein [Stutzerimonas nitrititolerans]|uniref:phage tail protein n=1 Tax=Stutzerimonas nitrititolerans TaxID=2482751 RepID=UPI00289E91B2|nr:phage tail protein [Stutzerimonas nitrititolerans]
MVDINTQFGGFLTDLGAAKNANANALGVPWKLTHMLIGDANGADPVPAPGQTALVNQVYRAQLNQLYVSPTDANVLIAELVLPPNVGGWWIRELALEDEDGVFSAVAKCPPSYKPVLAQGSGRNQVVRMHVITSGTANIQLKIDPSVVLATRAYVDGLTARAAQVDAEIGTDNSKIMTALRVWQAITKRFSTKAQAEAGEDNNTAMTPLRVFQAVAKAVVQATQDVAGIAKVATKAKTLEGVDDSSFITPFKLRWGVAASLGTNGYIALPTWLFGLIFQWGRFDATANQTGSVSFPLAFVSDCFYGEIVLQRTAANATVKRVEGLSKTALTYNFDSWSTTYPVVTHRWFAFGV